MSHEAVVLKGPIVENQAADLLSFQEGLSKIAGSPIEMTLGSWTSVAVDCVPRSVSHVITVAVGETKLRANLLDDDMSPHVDETAYLVIARTQKEAIEETGLSMVLLLGRGSKDQGVHTYDWHKVGTIHTHPDGSMDIDALLPNNTLQRFELPSTKTANLGVLTGQQHWGFEAFGMDEVRDEPLPDAT